jgi:hypothetical protein
VIETLCIQKTATAKQIGLKRLFSAVVAAPIKLAFQWQHTLRPSLGSGHAKKAVRIAFKPTECAPVVVETAGKINSSG